MQRFKVTLSCMLLAAATGLVVQSILLLHAATAVARALPVTVCSEIQATRAALVVDRRYPQRPRATSWSASR